MSPDEPGIEEPEVRRVPPRTGSGRPPISPRVRRVAFTIAIVADGVQWVAFPFFQWGVISPLNDALDVVVALLMIRLIGFHWAFLPTFVVELLPFVDLVPSWTAAVWLATREKP